jgi:hypothetical protein
MKSYYRFAFAFVVTSLASMLGFACSSGDGSEPVAEVALGAQAPDSLVRNGLFHCDTDADCASLGGQACCAGYCALSSGAPGKVAQLVGGRLQYKCFANVGFAARNILPDYSFAGYRGGGVGLPGYAVLSPNPPYQVPLKPRGGGLDDAQNIQTLLDMAGQIAPLGDQVIAVYLDSGTFVIQKPLLITNSKVMLLGSGQGSDGTILKSTINEPHTLIVMAIPEIIGTTDTGLPFLDEELLPSPVKVGDPVRISATVRVGATRIPVESIPTGPSGWAVNDHIIIRRTPNQDWLTKIAPTPTNWKPYISMTNDGFPDHMQRRRIKAIDSMNKVITVNMPLVDWIIENPDSSYLGGGQVEKIQNPSYIDYSGVKDLRLDSQYVHTETSGGGWNGISMDRVRNSWIHGVTVLKYGGAAVTIGSQSMFNTVQEVAHLDPESPEDQASPGLPASGNRYSFNVSKDATGNLFQRCFTRGSRHSFMSGLRTHGPNVWLDSMALEQHAESGPHKEWNTGGLFDNIYADPSANLLLDNPTASTLAVQYSSNHGWRGAQTMFWNSDARVKSVSASTSRNFVVGGVIEDLGISDSIAELTNTVVKPRSLYLQQLEDRLGTAAVDAVTTARQKAGRIFDDLRAWAGEGRLEDARPDPTCLRGDRASTPGPTCCHESCDAKCGAGDCNDGGMGSLCCVQAIKASGRSCAHYPPPCLMPDPTCSFSEKENGQYCCSASCAACATSGCGGAPPDATCCSGSMRALKRSCREYPPPCIEESDPTCAFGVPGPGVCCDPGCHQCDGAGCGDAPNIASKCCKTNIIQAGLSCDMNMAPCILPP